jgi:hydroxymethylpyrimidine kinase/phosphomethylpyrimidine kinase/thiamine-phosphate diphosphorylase
MQPVVWTIAGCDPSAGAGVMADSHTLTTLDCCAQVIVTAITAQNGTQVTHCEAVSSELLQAQFYSLRKLGWPQVIKIGLLPNAQIVNGVSELLQHFTGYIVYDPVMISSNGFELMTSDAVNALKEKLLPRVDILTPNIVEAQILTGQKINNAADMLHAGKTLCHMGTKQVILKGGHRVGPLVQDLWTDGGKSYWLSSERIEKRKTHGTGCVFSSSLAAFIAKGYEVADAFVLAKMTVSQSIQHAHVYNDVAFARATPWQACADFLPWLTFNAEDAHQRKSFPSCEMNIGFYPIVDSARWVKKAIDWQVKSIQLRLKNNFDEICTEIQQAVAYTQNKNIQLFINDYWEFAIENKAYGVHLGQEDLIDCDISALRLANIRLGISTHSYAELARAHALQPSYIAFGPIYSTKSKPMRFPAQGTLNLQRWRELVTGQLVAIGGITLHNLPQILACAVDGVSLISAFTKADDPQETCQQFLAYFQCGLEHV